MSHHHCPEMIGQEDNAASLTEFPDTIAENFVDTSFVEIDNRASTSNLKEETYQQHQEFYDADEVYLEGDEQAHTYVETNDAHEQNPDRSIKSLGKLPQCHSYMNPHYYESQV
jgi:lysyl-tRNA synthetase class II